MPDNTTSPPPEPPAVASPGPTDPPPREPISLSPDMDLLDRVTGSEIIDQNRGTEVRPRRED